MGYYGRLKDKLFAQELRKQGYSYKEILLKIKASKDTISRWCRDIKLTPEQKERLLKKKLLGQRKGSIVAADNKRRLRLINTKKIFFEAKKQLGILSKRDRFIAGIALYAGDGNKSERHGGFANSSPQLIKFMVNWLREFCKIPKERFRGAIWLHDGRDENKAKRFWSSITGIPLKQFHKTYIAKDKTNSNKVRKKIHNYGIFAIRFSHSNIQRKILGWISSLFNDKIHDVP